VPLTDCLVKGLGRVEQPADAVSEPPQRALLGQVFQHPRQVATLRIVVKGFGEHALWGVAEGLAAIATGGVFAAVIAK